jgi:hypothetical protein
MSTTPRTSPTPWPRRSWPICRWWPAATPGRATTCSRTCSPTANSRSPVCRPGDTAKLLLTSGSTGRPKAVICTHANIALNAAQIAACYEDPDPPVLVNSAPWSHSLGANAILHMVLHRGGTLYIDAGQPLAGAVRRDGAQPPRSGADLSQHGPGRLGPAGRRAGARPGPGGRFFEKVRVLQYGGASMAQSILDRVQAVAVRTIGPAGDLRGRLRGHRDRPDRLQHPLAQRPLGHGRPAHAGHLGQAGPGGGRRAPSSRSG